MIIVIYKWFGGDKKVDEEELETVPIINSREIMAAKQIAAVSRPQATGEIPSIFLHDGLNQTGPFTLSQIEAGLRDGTISRDIVCWSEGMADWQGVSELAGPQ